MRIARARRSRPPEEAIEEGAGVSPPLRAMARSTSTRLRRAGLTVAAWAGDEVRCPRPNARRVRHARGPRPVPPSHDCQTQSPRRDEPCNAASASADTMAAQYLIASVTPRLPAGRARPEAGLGAPWREPTAPPSAPCSPEWLPSASAVASRRMGSPSCSSGSSCRGRRARRDGRQVRKARSWAAFESHERFTPAHPARARVWELAGEQFTIGSPQQLAPILFDSSALCKRRGKTASPPTPESCTQSATSIRSSPPSRNGAR